ncbi:MAG: hypothetical protein IJ299_04875 [Oscillospiraceae bacterium]|nr:hypothetical protein [Oscillospiraceae bacterium]
MTPAKRITVSACALFIMLGFVAGGVSQLWEFESETEATIVESALPAEPEKPEHNEKYVLKIQDGIVVVFNESDPTRPIIVTDIYAGTLRHFDREQLSQGIVANGEFELQSMLEDFSS